MELVCGLNIDPEIPEFIEVGVFSSAVSLEAIAVIRIEFSFLWHPDLEELLCYVAITALDLHISSRVQGSDKRVDLCVDAWSKHTALTNIKACQRVHPVQHVTVSNLVTCPVVYGEHPKEWHCGNGNTGQVPIVPLNTILQHIATPSASMR
eukprot:1950259-Amphidinium_carterae.1